MTSKEYEHRENQHILTNQSNRASILPPLDTSLDPTQQRFCSSYTNNPTWPNQQQTIERNQRPHPSLASKPNTSHTPTSEVDSEDEFEDFSNNEDVPLANQYTITTIQHNLSSKHANFTTHLATNAMTSSCSSKQSRGGYSCSTLYYWRSLFMTRQGVTLNMNEVLPSLQE